jgi:hypothetical protein
MHHHGSHLRSRIIDYVTVETENKSNSLLNCGIIGGHIQTIKPLLESIWEIHKNYNFDNTTSFTGDMGAFNYTARTHFNNNLIHGAPVNTVFKEYESSSMDCWFRHK